MTPHEELELLDAELERLQSEHPNTSAVLRLTDQCLRGCSNWKWAQHRWTVSHGQTCGIINGNARTTRTFPDPESLGLEIFSEGGEATLKSLHIWEMKSMWE